MSNDRNAAFDRLTKSHIRLTGTRITDLFQADADRFASFSTRANDFLLDWSKTRIDDEAFASLLALAQAAAVEAQRDAMMRGDAINTTENRAVLHTAIRRFAPGAISVAGRDVMPDILTERKKLFRLAEQIRLGEVCGTGGEAFTDVVNIGIGGSDLGPAMAVQALTPYHTGPRLHFVSNIDGAHLADTLSGLSPSRTLIIVASKTFTTIETMTNARSARAWIAEALGEDAVGAHFAAVTTALDKAAAFPIAEDRIVGFWDFVGGRYSIWSSIGLPLAIAIGAPLFEDFLKGAESMDQHFTTAPLEQNLPVILALVSIWHRIAEGFPSRALISYDQRLQRFPAYVQQLDMESNGKRVGKDGMPLSRPSGAIVWGEPGTNAQHAFFQLLHQGTDIVPVEFLLAAEGHEPQLKEHHDLLIANCLAQSEALMVGRTEAQAEAQLIAMGRDAMTARNLAPHRVFPGNRPSITLLYPSLTPASLGGLIALYEHRVFVEAAIFGINAFDQWGVELGKELATKLLPVVTGEARFDGLTGSTIGLIQSLKK